MRHYFLLSDGYILTGEASKGAGKPSVLHGKARAMSLSPATTAAAAASEAATDRRKCKLLDIHGATLNVPASGDAGYFELALPASDTTNHLWSDARFGVAGGAEPRADRDWRSPVVQPCRDAHAAARPPLITATDTIERANARDWVEGYSPPAFRADGRRTTMLHSPATWRS